MKKILSLTLALLMLMIMSLPTISAQAAGQAAPSFTIKHELKVYDGTTLLFSQEPTEILTGDQYWQGVAYVMPVGTKVAQLMDGELTMLSVFGESDIKNDVYANGTYEVILTEAMGADIKGVRICGSGRERGLLTVFISEDSGLTTDITSFDVAYYYNVFDGSTLLFSENPLRSFEDELYYRNYAYEFPVGTKIAQILDGKLIPIYIASEDSIIKGRSPMVDYKYYMDYEQAQLEVTLTTSMSLDPVGIRICSTNMNRGLLAVIVNGDGYDVVDDAVNNNPYRHIPPTPPADSIIRDPYFYEALLKEINKSDGYAITVADVAGITELDLNAKNISDLSGIEYFTSLTTLHCAANQLNTVDLSRNPTLEWLNCNQSRVEVLNITGCTQLKILMCYDNQLTKLDFSTNSSLDWVDCGSNNLTQIDLRNNINLSEFHCTRNLIPTQSSIIGLNEERTLLDFHPQKNAPDLDTASGWAQANITSALSKGFVPEDLQGNFTNVITRQEFCRMAIKFVEYSTEKSIDALLAEKNLSRDPGAFSDTNDPGILAAYALGITSGTSATRFSPSDNFTREQAATMLMNVCAVLGMDTSAPDAGFADSNQISSWAVDGVNFCYANGIMSGVGTNKFDPQGVYTRQESIVTFDRI